MTLKELGVLKEGDWVILRDGREGVFLEAHEYSRKMNCAFVFVSLPNEEGCFSHNENLWPAQIKYKKGGNTMRM
ncbi:MAG: hypothetical protein JRE23_08710 [Deltaproteobacteria bacterium]|nr:hypothetical protein [Deltaproteobacteria bacterium]